MNWLPFNLFGLPSLSALNCICCAVFTIATSSYSKPPHALHTENMEWKGHVHLHSLKDDCPVMDCVVKALLLRLQNLIIMHYLLIINFLLNLYLAFCAAASQCNSLASRHRPRSTAPSVVAVVIIILDKNNNKFAKKSGHGPQHDDDESRCGGFLG